MYGKKQWRGLEVEGRYSDIMTFFVRELINNKLSVKEYKDYPHYYFTIEYMRQLIFHDNSQYLSVIRHILDTTNCAVTIEAANDTLKNIPVDLVNRCHIIYRIIDDGVQLLKDTDTLSIDAGWYRCHMISKMHMQETKPTSYMYDEEI
jgi:hypothetical protein